MESNSIRHGWASLVASICASVLLTAMAGMLSGCRVAEETVKLPMRAVGDDEPSSQSGAPDSELVQTELQRFADEYSSRTVASLDAYAQHMGTEEARRQALRWKIAAGTAALGIAGGPNPQANLVDFLALTTITRMALEEVWVKTADGAAFQPWLDAGKALETEAWDQAKRILTAEQQQEMQDAIRDWWQSNPEVHTEFFVRPQEFSSLIRRTGEKSSRPGSLFSLIGLDPTAGLDPAVREVARSRMFAERALFVMQRMPLLVRWQIELITDETLHESQIVRALESADRLSNATESISETAGQLPDRITAERKAILEALEAQEGKLRELSAEATRTLTAGENMSTSLNATLKTFDALMQRFGVGETTAASAPDPASRPFDILDYAQTAEKVTAMTKELNEAIKELNTTLDSPALDSRMLAVDRVVDHGTANVRSLIYQAFALAAAVVLLGFACAVIYRKLGR